ncbi:MAG TPA: hypothetical protein VFE98_04810 [Candidatus Bathyarchaeia archaeon]|nr:hypothetical protein [Candidatus Bathyarchaeia archaeon]
MTSVPTHPRGAWLSALVILAFIPAFGLARLFTFVLPRVVVVQSGIHFHHFWYGIVLLAASGWLGIAGSERWSRLAAIMYGLGGGLLADEVGLLLTFGEYQNAITYTIVVGALAVGGVGAIFQRYGKEIFLDLRKIALHERTVYFALFILGLPIMLESLTQLQTDTVGILVALIYRTKFGGSWKISRKQFLIELQGFLAILPLIIVPSLVIDYVLSVEFGPSLIEVSLPILAAGTVAGLVISVAAGLVGGWIWVRIIRRAMGPRKTREPGGYANLMKDG